jgi:hypothetical protein
VKANVLKTLGYLVSTASVVLLGIVAWFATRDHETLRWCLVGGMLASMAGMFLRWLSYQEEKG